MYSNQYYYERKNTRFFRSPLDTKAESDGVLRSRHVVLIFLRQRCPRFAFCRRIVLTTFLSATEPKARSGRVTANQPAL